MKTLGACARSQVRRWATACASAVALTAVVMIETSTAQAVSATLYVANNGTDNADCGPEGKLPCRSISRAVTHANPGDRIVVGPGLYGDINRDGIVDASGDSGEEAPVAVEPLNLPHGTVSLAMINIDKQVTIVSRDGAGATVIDAGGQFIANYFAVNAAADGVVFGKSGKGFTIRNTAVGLYINVAGVTVRGTLAETCYWGFMAGKPTEVTGGMAQGTVFKGNVAMSNTGGGFAVNDDSAVVKGNLAKGNLGGGFGLMGSSGTVTKNLAIDNLGPGFVVSLTAATAPTFSKNAAIGNTDAGLFIYGLGAAPIAMTVEKNTFFGNGVKPAFPPANCGLAIQNLGVETLTVNADGNYWGAESGPGGNPADAVGGSCTAGAVTLNLIEWASKEIKVKAPAMK